MKDIIKYKGQNVSWVKDLNLLKKDKQIYVMDNHAAALWCWIQEIDKNEKYNVLHIDVHYDTMASRIDSWIEHLPDNYEKIGIENFLDLKFYDSDFRDGYEIMRWDNYFPIFHRLYGNNINEYHFFTHKEGSMFEEMEKKLIEYSIPALFNLIDFLFDEDINGTYKWIVNIDLDYFFQSIDDTDITIKFISDEAIDFFIKKLKHYLLADKVKVMTIALSPECCGGWTNALNLMNQFAKGLDLNFELK